LEAAAHAVNGVLAEFHSPQHHRHLRKRHAALLALKNIAIWIAIARTRLKLEVVSPAIRPAANDA